MPVITLTIAKVAFLIVLYLFLFWSFKTVVRTIRDTTQRSGRAEGIGRKIHFEVVEPREHRGTKVPLVDGMRIGRDADCALVLDDQYVSGHHTAIRVRGDDFFVEDLGSTNGTIVNRRKISQPTRIRRGDTVQIGRTVMEVAR